jgi:CHAT domain-containing protein/tetratricopeptide (TPR) repeat protein
MPGLSKETTMKTNFLLSRHSLSNVPVIVVFLLLQLPVTAQETPSEIRQLVIGEKTERKVSANQERHTYAIAMKRGQVLRVNFQERGADVTAIMQRASDQQKVSAKIHNGLGFMRESLTFIADRDGVYWLVVTTQRVTGTNREALYEFLTALKNTSSPNDVQRVKAETLIAEGTQLLEGRDKTNAALAIKKFEQSLTIWNRLGDVYWAQIAMGNIATAYILAGDYTTGEFYLRQALRTFTDINNEPEVALISAALSAVYLVTDNEEAASQHFHKALEISRRLGDKRQETVLGLFLPLISKTNRPDLATELAAVRAKGDKVAEAAVWARKLFQYVIKEESIKDEERRTFFETAEREALPLLSLIKNRDLELQIILGLGIGFHDLALVPDKAAALAHKKKSLTYMSRVVVLARVQNNLLAQSLAYDYLNVFYEGDNERLAIFFGKKSIKTLQDFKQDLRVFDKEDQQGAARKVDRTYSSLAADLFFAGRLAEAHQVLNFSRDQEFFDLDLTQDQEIPRLSLTSREMENEQLFEVALENIAAAYAKLADADYQLAGEELQLTLRKLEQDFNAPLSKRDIAANVTDTIDMQSALRELTAKAGKKYAAVYIVENVGQVLLITPDEVFAFASSTGPGPLSNYVPSFKMDEYILDFLHTLRSPDLDPRHLGAEIYKKIFKTNEVVAGEFTQTTLEEKLKHFKPDVLLWSLSGNLRYVPVAALYDDKAKQYLVEKYQNAVFTRARKERFLVEPKAWSRSVGFGNSLAYEKHSALPNVPNEISSIFGSPKTKKKGFFKGEVLLNRGFTREAMLASLKSQPGLVHIASHFVFQPGDSRNSFLLLGDGSKFSLLEMQQTPNLFAGVDLLTLSACETAAQQRGADGKEVDGFAELAQRLGASSVIATLWRIADDGTSKFMTEFYRLRQANPKAPKSEILRQAQLSFLKKKRTGVTGKEKRGAVVVGTKPVGIRFNPRDGFPFEHPYYWASFVLFGSTR